MNMQSRAAFRGLRSRFEKIEALRRSVQTESGVAQRLSKQAIFSLLRGEIARAREQLGDAEKRLRSIRSSIRKEPRLASDAGWRAALEEFCEASFVENVILDKEVLPAPDVTDEPDILIGGLADLVGELVRLTVRAATDGNRKQVEELSRVAERVVEFLTSLDLTGSLRQKGDQARQHLRRLEDVRYDVSRRA